MGFCLVACNTKQFPPPEICLVTNITDGAGGSKENKSCCNVKATVGKVFILFQYFNEGIESSLILSGPLSNANNSTTESPIMKSPLRGGVFH